MSVVQGPIVHKKEGFHPGVQLYPNVSSLKVPNSCHVHKSLNLVLIKEAFPYKSESTLHQRGPLGNTVPKH